MHRRTGCGRLFVVVVALSIVGPVAGGRLGAQDGGRSAAADTLAPRHRVSRGVLRLDIGRLRTLRIDPEFSYLGGQRFILKEVADAEQHFFVVADSARLIQRLYWIQLEQLLPDSEGRFAYDEDSTLVAGGLPLRTNVRTYSTPPDTSSDRARAYALLESRGYRMPEGATRVRLVYLPDTTARREVMMVYVEAGAAADSASAADDQTTLINRALAGLTLRSRR